VHDLARDRSAGTGCTHRKADAMEQAKEIRFGRWTLRRDSGELWQCGRTVRLRAQSQRVLEALLERPGEVVTREALIARLWPRGVVDFETGLNSAVGRLRRALDDDADVPRYIETLPRRGYRFIGDVRDAEETAGPDVSASASPPDVRPQRRRVAVALLRIAAAALVLAGGAATPLRRAAPPQLASAARDDAANERYRIGRYFLGRRNAGDLERARAQFETAVAIDPAFAEAYAGLASTRWLLVVEGRSRENVEFPEMLAAANRAIQLDPGLAEAHLRLALYALKIGRRDLYDLHAASALRAQPDNALLLSLASSDALSRGRLDDGIALARRAVASEPLVSAYRYNLAWALFLAGRYEEAKQANLELVELDPSAWADVAGQSLVLEGRFEQALQLVTTWPDNAAKYEVEALAYHGLRRAAEADASLTALIRTVRDTDPLRIVEVYAYRGEPDAALGWLAIGSEWFRCGNHTQASPSLEAWSMRLSPFVASLREDPRWQDLVARLDGA
jgi:DNA-binding winged helix-turn-helix (wHTH) protein